MQNKNLIKAVAIHEIKVIQALEKGEICGNKLKRLSSEIISTEKNLFSNCLFFFLNCSPILYQKHSSLQVTSCLVWSAVELS